MPAKPGPWTAAPVRIPAKPRPCFCSIFLNRAAANPKGNPLATLPITLVDGEQSHELVIDTDRAKGALTALVGPLPHEAIAANNLVAFQITPHERKIRVIYMEGTAPPEYRFLQEALEEDPDIKCVSMYVDDQLSARPQLRRVDEPNRGFPTTREELLSYDVVICSDIARGAFTPQQLEWTVELVNKRGGGFAMIGGYTSFGAGSWDQTVWDGIIPVDMNGRGPERSPYYNGSVQVIVPAQVTEHPIWRIVDDPIRNRQVLAQMPMFHGTNLTDRLKPAATPLGFLKRCTCLVSGRDGLHAKASAAVGPSPWRPTRPTAGERISRRAGARGTIDTSASSGATSSAGSPRIATAAIVG